MKWTLLKSYLWATSVISLCLIGIVNGQEQEAVNDTVYYKLLTGVIAQDTVVPEWRSKIIGYRVEKGLLTKEDSIKYYDIVKNRKLLLHDKKANFQAKEAMRKDIENKKFMEKYVSSDLIYQIMDRIPFKNGFHDQSLIGEKIEFIEEFPKWQIFHSFSSPIWVYENCYLVYHFRAGEGPTSFKTEFIFFSLEENENQNKDYIIDKTIVTYLH